MRWIGGATRPRMAGRALVRLRCSVLGLLLPHAVGRRLYTSLLPTWRMIGADVRAPQLRRSSSPDPVRFRAQSGGVAGGVSLRHLRSLQRRIR